MDLNTNNIDDLRASISYYLDTLSHGIKNDSRPFKRMEYINFFFLDLITTFCYQIYDLEDRQKFISNIKQIGSGLWREFERKKGDRDVE